MKFMRLLREVDLEELSDVCFTGGSTHVMKTCSLGGDRYFLKFSDEEGFYDGSDPSLQVLIEYLAYSIYSLYSGIKVPDFKLVFDAPSKRVGLATSPAQGSPALGNIDPRKLGAVMSQGVYVDILLSNWDVIGTGTGNVFYDELSGATRIDPGGSLTFRAQGERKGEKFSKRAGELKTMLHGDGGAGAVFKYSDLNQAAREFKSVPWGAINKKIRSVEEAVAGELENRGLNVLASEWREDVEEIIDKLKSRHEVILQHIEFAGENRSVAESTTNNRLKRKFRNLIELG